MVAFIFLFFSVLIGVVMFCGGFHFFLFFSVLIGVVMFCGGFQVFFFGFDRCCDVLWWLSVFFCFFRF